MNHKLLLVLAGALLAGPAHLPAQTAAPAPAAPAVTWTVTPAVVSHYMFRGMRFGGPSFQPTVEMGYGSLTAGVWANFPIKDKVPGLSDPEYDIYGGYTLTLNETTNVVIGGTWYVFPRADESAGFYRQTLEPSVALNYTVNGFRLTPKIYYDLMLEGATLECAAFYAVPLTDLGTELDFTAVVGTFKWDNAAENTIPPIRNWGNYWSAGVSLPFQVSANSKVTVGFSYVRGYDNFTKQGSAPKVENSLAVGRGVASIAYSLTF